MTVIPYPRIKLDLTPKSLKSKKYLREAKSHFIRNYSTSHFPFVTSFDVAQELEIEGSVSFAKEIARKKRETKIKHGTRSAATNELIQYLKDLASIMSTDALDW